MSKKIRKDGGIRGDRGKKDITNANQTNQTTKTLFTRTMTYDEYTKANAIIRRIDEALGRILVNTDPTYLQYFKTQDQTVIVPKAYEATAGLRRLRGELINLIH